MLKHVLNRSRLVLKKTWLSHVLHFTTVMGLPAPAHFSTAYDLGLLGQHIMNDYPQYFHFFSQKYFEYNHIRQPNFNRLLFTYQYATGMKTGSTEAAGYSLVSSAEIPNNPMKLVGVVLGTKSLNDVAAQSKALFNYGFHFFKQDTCSGQVKLYTFIGV